MYTRRRPINNKNFRLTADNRVKNIEHKGVEIEEEDIINLVSLTATNDTDDIVPQDNGVYTFTSSGETIVVSLDQVRHYLQTFKPYGLQPIVNLPTNINNTFETFSKFMKHVQSRPEIYEKIKEQILQVYPYDKTVVIPGTLNAYFIGCQCSNFDNETRGCDPKCIDNLPALIDGQVITNACNDYVLVYENNEIMSLHEGNNNSTVAWVYVPNNFTTFSSQAISEMQANGIVTLNLLYADSSNTYSEIKNNVPLSNFTEGKNITVVTPSTDNVSNNSILGIVILVICILVIIIVVIRIIYIAQQRRQLDRQQLYYNY